VLASNPTKKYIWKSWSWSGNLSKTVVWIQSSLFKMCWIPSDSSPENRILCTSSMHPKVEIECCQPCGFPAKLGLFFCGIEVFFENLRVACFWACFNCNLLVFWACFLQISVLPIAFSSNFMAIFCFNLFLKAYWECFGENFVILNLFFRICHHAFLFNFLADFSFCYIFLPTHVVFFRSNYLFLACFSYFLACFCKITWHHSWNWKCTRHALWVSVVPDPDFWSPIPQNYEIFLDRSRIGYHFCSSRMRFRIIQNVLNTF